jgi:plastocyanin
MYASYILTSCLAAIAAAKTIPVSVSNATIGLVFTPASLTADVGDVVTFHFFPRNHSVAQGSLEAPCKPLAANSFFSGFVPIANGTSNTTFSITIADKNPIWYYCSQAKHCNAGMAGVINPPYGYHESLTQLLLT